VLERKGDDVGAPRLSNSSRLGFQATLVECVHRLGDSARARSIAEESRTDLRDRGMLPSLAEINLVLAGILADGTDRADFDRMESLLDEVDEIVGTTGARLFVPFAMERRATLAALRGDRPERLHLLCETQRLFEGVGATGHAERLAKELA